MGRCKFTIMILLTFFSVSVFAGGGRSGWVDITKIQLIDDSFKRLYLYNVVMGSSDCDSKTPTLFFSDTGLSKEIYSMILSAKMSGTKVELIAAGCKAIGATTYPSISAMYMQ